jgi:hypothetical protein
MARVDPDDDSISRFVVQHFRYDPERRQHRRIPVAAYDNEAEYEAGIAALQADLDRRRREGEDVDPRERATGMSHRAGDRDRQAYRRFLMRSFSHGVDVRPFLAERPAPGGLVFMFLDDEDGTEQEPETPPTG